jgi:uncharacterized protein
MNHLSNAFKGANSGWRYLLLFVLSFFGGQVVGGIPLLVVMVYKMASSGGAIAPNPENMADLSVYGIDQNLGLVLMMLPFLFSLLFLLVLFKPLHKRNYASLFSAKSTVRWRRFFVSAGIWAVFMGIYLMTDYNLNPENFVWNFNTGPFIILCLISFLLIPFQASYEEILFRGYLAQGLTVWTKNRLFVVLVPSLLFGLMHSFNPEINAFGFWLVMPQYVFIGLMFGLMSVFDDGIELAMGAHTANNIFLSILVSSKSSVLQTPSLFVQQTIDPLKDLMWLIILGFIFLVFLGYLYKWDLTIVKKKIELDEYSENQTVDI